MNIISNGIMAKLGYNRWLKLNYILMYSVNNFQDVIKLKLNDELNI